ncbi:hypothetical protein CBS63078_10739 [Aspergillus niger]|nr:hypothetical protein CBS11852_10884 [Aspergillus niger]KAI2887307.1 hypothetical protein CBS63078_10739 [Aspergillus niger]KAI3016209.1 hypothetical protein CBS147347_10864 [Aspergillus niger]KAI3055887.1 hypothetical protein CBS147353_11266 [Aspergillus niger]
MISPRDCEASLEEYELTSSFTAGAEGYCAPNVEPVISKSPSIQNPPTFEVYWEDSDTENPRMWPLWYKGLTVIAMSLGATAVSLSSTLYTSGIPEIQEDFSISKLEALLGVTTYLLEGGTVPPEAMVSIVSFGATLLAVGQLWFAWTCTSNINWIVPILAGVPFGAGNACVFIYASSYLARSYGIYAASALAGNMLLRSILGASFRLQVPQCTGLLA